MGTKVHSPNPNPNPNLKALEWATAHQDHISSLSIIGYGEAGAENITGSMFNEACSKMGIETYQLKGGAYVNFNSNEAIEVFN